MSKSKNDLSNLIEIMKGDNFRQCDSYYIDEDEYCTDENRRFTWIPSKTMSFNGELLMEEFQKYYNLCIFRKLNFGGITASDRQPLD